MHEALAFVRYAGDSFPSSCQLEGAPRLSLVPKKARCSCGRTWVERLLSELGPSTLLLLIHGVFHCNVDIGCACWRTTMNLCTVLATFFANLERVIGSGGLRKSLVGICRLHGAYPGHCAWGVRGY